MSSERIKSWPTKERPRERLLAEGPEAKHLNEGEELRQIEEAFLRFNRELDPEQTDPPSRVRKLAYGCIFGTDAEPRLARTAFRSWFIEFDAAEWDRQIETDSDSGKLDRLAQSAIEEYRQHL